MFKDLLHAAHMAMMIGQKILVIHHSGATKEVSDKIHSIMSDVHKVISLHHVVATDKQETEMLERIFGKEKIGEEDAE